MDSETSEPRRQPDPPGGEPPRSEPTNADLRRDLRAATRSGRYALATAVCAAIISSGVSAGAAIYVSTTEARQKESAETAQAIRENRQKVYSDFAGSLFGYLEKLSWLEGGLNQRPPDREEIRDRVAMLTDRGLAMWRMSFSVLLVGNLEMMPFVERFGADQYRPFLTEHLNPFIERNLGRSPGSEETLRADSPALVAAIEGMVGSVSDFLDGFLGLARRDLGLGEG